MAKRLSPLLVAAAVGVGIYLVTRKPAAASSSSSSDRAPAPSPSLGDPSDPNSPAYDCAIADRLYRIGHPVEAAGYAQRCKAAGGTIPGH